MAKGEAPVTMLLAMSLPPIHLVAATRVGAGAFGNGTLLGRSLQQPQHQSLLPVIT